VSPPELVVDPEEEDVLELKALALMNRQHWNGIRRKEVISDGTPVAGRSSPAKADPDCFFSDLKGVA
jgi:hypothetical protein